MSITAITFIREESKRLPNKSTKLISGKPLFDYSIQKFSNNKHIDRCIIYTNSKCVENFYDKNPEIEIINRQKSLDLDVTFNDIMNEAIKHVNTEYILYFCVTSPFIKTETIDDIVKNILNKKQTYDSAFTAKQIRSFCWFNGETLNYSLTGKVPFTQDLEPVIVESSGFYLFRKDEYQTNSRRIGDKPYIKIIDEIEAHDIDYPEDLVIAKNYIKSGVVNET